MTQKQFCTKLRKCIEKLNAKPYHDHQEIRFVIGRAQLIYCPLTLMACCKSGRKFKTNQHHEAAKVLNIGDNFRRSVIVAADDGYDRSKQFRKIMILACGLKS